ncbi:TPA: molybdopterin converting factor subunit 1 [Staphylococcus argenteus]|uniref:molybdopterin converting factor subunit 1 n=1 Tax=Staphylococcus argenteus TaxID=985002 RepID=UPI000233FE9C|nr:molybdopterin converting factor subunit 1 [Staphylococcus argenteus]MBE2130824.1 molybdopterin converting factor subunit 1 [Staphylococcus argenteus]PNY96503.1 molybdopterin converting factor subunit 1 [Staphylococcus argenteus]CCE59923.1 putative molybdopterin-synthase small subunit [Staphylococcus argenteus]SUJ23651.1 putative molybdopterin-synthase small subunit [Staphylococcus argenteus]HDY9428828.1 molybdopterin converting factor subunit 1 [Staphylococcus argenteus]
MKVLYFAEIKEILKKGQEDIVLEKAVTVQQFESFLFERYPQINNKKFQVAVNEEFVQKSDFINPNDTVALIPPVSGG